MSVKNLNKVIIISSALTGKVLMNIDYDDYAALGCAQHLIANKIYQLIDNDEGAVVKIGSKG